MSTRFLKIRALAPEDIGACSRILYSLPDWFGLEESIRAYVDSLHTSPGAVATHGDEIVGFIALVQHTGESYEINVMAVPEEHHRSGIGSALIDWAENWCRERRIPWLHVKTRGPSTPDPGYDRTRQFYVACGYAPLFESLTLWGPENAALVLVKHIAPRISGKLMFDHVVFGVTNYAASKAFFLKALEPLGVAVVQEGPLGVELCRPDSKSSLCIRQKPEEKPAHLHLAFTAENRQQVEAFYRAALKAGAKDNGAPGLRPNYHANYYAAFVIGPDGHNVEAVCHEPEA